MDNLSLAFAALCDPTRRQIFDRLSRAPAIVSELVKPFRMTQQCISKHLAYLERARLIEKSKRGREHLCILRVDAVREIADWAEGYRRFWDARLDKFSEALERTYTATLQDVWDLWTTREWIESWWGPGGFSTRVLVLDLRAGGKLRYEMSATGPEQVQFMKTAGMPLTIAGLIHYTEVVPKTRFDFRSEAPPCKILFPR